MLIFDYGKETDNLRNIMLANSTMHLEEDVCEYALYCIAKGVQAMHKSNFVV